MKKVRAMLIILLVVMGGYMVTMGSTHNGIKRIITTHSGSEWNTDTSPALSPAAWSLNGTPVTNEDTFDCVPSADTISENGTALFTVPDYTPAPDDMGWGTVSGEGKVTSLTENSSAHHVVMDVRSITKDGVAYGVAQNDTSYNPPSYIYVYKYIAQSNKFEELFTYEDSEYSSTRMKSIALFGNGIALGGTVSNSSGSFAAIYYFNYSGNLMWKHIFSIPSSSAWVVRDNSVLMAGIVYLNESTGVKNVKIIALSPSLGGVIENITDTGKTLGGATVVYMFRLRSVNTVSGGIGIAVNNTTRITVYNYTKERSFNVHHRIFKFPMLISTYDNMFAVAYKDVNNTCYLENLNGGVWEIYQTSENATQGPTSTLITPDYVFVGMCLHPEKWGEGHVWSSRISSPASPPLPVPASYSVNFKNPISEFNTSGDNIEAFDTLSQNGSAMAMNYDATPEPDWFGWIRVNANGTARYYSRDFNGPAGHGVRSIAKDGTAWVTTTAATNENSDIEVYRYYYENNTLVQAFTFRDTNYQQVRMYHIDLTPSYIVLSGAVVDSNNSWLPAIYVFNYSGALVTSTIFYLSGTAQAVCWNSTVYAIITYNNDENVHNVAIYEANNPTYPFTKIYDSGTALGKAVSTAGFTIIDMAGRYSTVGFAELGTPRVHIFNPQTNSLLNYSVGHNISAINIQGARYHSRYGIVYKDENGNEYFTNLANINEMIYHLNGAGGGCAGVTEGYVFAGYNYEVGSSHAQIFPIIYGENASPPSAPQGLRASAGNGYVQLSWSAPTSDGGAPITAYNIYRGTSSGAESYIAQVSGSTLTYNDTSVSNGVTYYYYITAVNSAGEGDKSDEVSATPRSAQTVPSPPQSIGFTTGNGYVNITWKVPDDGGSPITEYKIYRNGSFFAMVPAVQQWFNDTSVVNGVTYSYYVTAVNSVGESNSSEEIKATPPGKPDAPANLHVRRGNMFVNITWNEESWECVNEFKVYRNGSIYAIVPGTQRWFNDTAVINGITYSYYLVAVNPAGESEPSKTVHGTPATVPDAPENFHAKTGNRFVELLWHKPYNGGTRITGYRIYRNGTPYANVDGNSTTFNDTHVKNGVTYRYWIVAINSIGTGKRSLTLRETPMWVPDAPSNLTATVSAGYVNLSWSAPYDEGSPIEEYRIYRNGTVYATVPGKQLWYNDTMVSCGNYSYTVTAINAVGEGPMSEPLNITVPVAGSPPAAPTNISIYAGVGYLNITWSIPNGSDVDGFIVYRNDVPVANLSVSQLWYNDTNVSADMDYTYYVVAYNQFGMSNRSASIHGTPLARSKSGNMPLNTGEAPGIPPWLLIIPIILVAVALALLLMKRRGGSEEEPFPEEKEVEGDEEAQDEEMEEESDENMITATCPSCGFSAPVPEEMRGSSVQCPQCGEIFTIE